MPPAISEGRVFRGNGLSVEYSRRIDWDFDFGRIEEGSGN